jgi:hypothetical protein
MTALIVVSFIFIISIFATMLPILPGTVFAFAGVVIHKLWMGEASVSWKFVIITFCLAMLAQVLDLLFTWWGARRFGATWKGAIGAVLGAIFGAIFFNIPGMIIGPIVGAFLFEWLNNRTTAEATRAGFGTLVGGVLALGTKIALTIGICIAFFYSLPSPPAL